MTRPRRAFIIVAAVLLTLSASLAVATAAQARGFKVVQFIGSGGSGLPFNTPVGIAVNNVPESPCYGDIYAVDHNVSEFEIFGQTVLFGANVWRFNSAGEFEDVRGQFGSGDGEFKRPFGLAIDLEGNVLVTDSWYASGHVPNNRVQKFDCNLNFVTKWGSSVPNTPPLIEHDNMLDAPAAIDVGSDGKIYVADSGFNADHPGSFGNRMVKYSGAGGFERTWGRGVLDGSPAAQICLASCRQGSAGFGQPETDTGAGMFDIPNGVAVDRTTGSVYVADTDNNRVQKFDSSGNFESAWGVGVDDGTYEFQVCTESCRAGTYTGELRGFKAPEGVHVDAAGIVYVADTGNHRIQTFDSLGNYLAQWDSGAGTIPKDVATDNSGNIYVTTPGLAKIRAEAKKCPSRISLKGSSASNSLTGTFEPDKILGGRGKDTISGLEDSDCLYGGADSDVLSGGDGDDRLTGSSGNDNLNGGAGVDRFSGGGGNDTIDSRDGEMETVSCGGGSDTVTADPADRLSSCETKDIS